VAAVLSDAQRAAGHDSRHVWAIESTLWSEPLSAPVHTMAAGLDQFMIRKKGFDAPVSLVRDTLRWNLDAALGGEDIIHLHNLNGLGRVGELARRFPEKKIVWTLHDMNPFTGACHYALGCTKYTQGCSSCPAVKLPFRGLVETSIERKLSSLEHVKNLHLVAPSGWLTEAARASKPMSRFPLSTIHNPLDPEFFSSDKKKSSPLFTFVVVAQNLEDPVKNVSTAVQAFAQVRREHPEATMALVGRGGSIFVREGIRLLGPLGRSELSEALQSSHALVVPSLAENAPMVIAEAASQGCLALVRDAGGMPGMINDLGAGQSFSDLRELKGAMAGILSQKNPISLASRQALTRRAQSLYSPEAARKQYDKVYER
jgi:glycosyltransferase involved in cell wall biosynthesis